MTERIHGTRPTPGIPGRTRPVRPQRRTQPVKRDGTTYMVINEDGRMVDCDPSLERARTTTLRTSLKGIAKLYRADGSGKLTSTTPIAVYIGGEAV